MRKSFAVLYHNDISALGRSFLGSAGKRSTRTTPSATVSSAPRASLAITSWHVKPPFEVSHGSPSRQRKKSSAVSAAATAAGATCGTVAPLAAGAGAPVRNVSSSEPAGAGATRVPLLVRRRSFVELRRDMASGACDAWSASNLAASAGSRSALSSVLGSSAAGSTAEHQQRRHAAASAASTPSNETISVFWVLPSPFTLMSSSSVVSSAPSVPFCS